MLAVDRILMPAFGPSAMLDMFEGMQDLASQMLLKWERCDTTAVSQNGTLTAT